MLNDLLYEQMEGVFDLFLNAIPKLLRGMFCDCGEGRQFETNSLKCLLKESIRSSVVRIGTFAT